jgi:hypothetical protein
MYAVLISSSEYAVVELSTKDEKLRKGKVIFKSSLSERRKQYVSEALPLVADITSKFEFRKGVTGYRLTVPPELAVPVLFAGYSSNVNPDPRNVRRLMSDKHYAELIKAFGAVMTCKELNRAQKNTVFSALRVLIKKADKLVPD